MFLNIDLCVKNDSKTFFVNDVFVIDEYFPSYLHKKIALGGLRPQTPDAFGLKLKPTGSHEILVDIFESSLQNLLGPRNFI